jgi:hypothetical protein
MALIEAGTYTGKIVEATIHEAPSGAVMFRARVDVGGAVLNGGICLIQKDGTLSERGFKDVQSILGWTAWDWAAFDNPPESFAGHDVDAVVETVEGEKGQFSSIKYMNPPGGGQQLTKADGKALAAKYGAKTRALFGGAPAAPAKPAAPKPPPATVKPPLPTAPAVKPSSMEECWDVFIRVNPGKTELDLYALWPKAIAEATGGKNQNDCTPEDWGKVLDNIDNVAF